MKEHFFRFLYSIFTNSYGKNKIQIDFWILKEHQIGKG